MNTVRTYISVAKVILFSKYLYIGPLNDFGPFSLPSLVTVPPRITEKRKKFNTDSKIYDNLFYSTNMISDICKGLLAALARKENF